MIELSAAGRIVGLDHQPFDETGPTVLVTANAMGLLRWKPHGAVASYA